MALNRDKMRKEMEKAKRKGGFQNLADGTTTLRKSREASNCRITYIL